MAPSSKQVRTLVSPAGSVVAERVPKGTQQPFKAEMSGSKSPFHSGRRRTDVHPDVVRPVGAAFTPHLTKQVQVATLSMWRYGFESRWGD